MLLTFFSKQNLEQNQPVIHYSDDTKTPYLFEALANSVINLFNSNDVSIAKFSFLLTQHAMYYPRQLPKHVMQLSIKEQCEYLLTYTQPHKKVLIPSIAYTLHQIAIDIMCQYPELYGNLLLEGHSIKALRQNQKLDDSGLLQALAKHALQTNIYIERYPSPYELPVKEFYTYQSSESSNSIQLHFKENTYRSHQALFGEKHG